MQMASNVNTTPFGFIPLATGLTGGPGRVKEYAQPATDTHQIFRNDLVTLVAGSSVSPTGFPSPAVQNVQSYSQGTPGTTPILGSCLNGNTAASKLGYIYVIDDPMALFIAMLANDVPTSFTVAADGAHNANVKNTAAAAGALNSAMAIEDTGIATTSTLDLKINGMLPVSPNIEGNFPILEVKINRHQLENQVAGI